MRVALLALEQEKVVVERVAGTRKTINAIAAGTIQKPKMSARPPRSWTAKPTAMTGAGNFQP